MKKSKKRIYIFAITLVAITIVAYVSAQQLNKSTSNPPAFNDNGKTVDSLKSAFQCKTIEFENWDKNDATDSTLTVCFINSSKMPGKDINESHAQFTAIAKQIKMAVQQPEKYKSYYIIFVERKKKNLWTSSSEAGGEEISAAGL